VVILKTEEKNRFRKAHARGTGMKTLLYKRGLKNKHLIRKAKKLGRNTGTQLGNKTKNFGRIERLGSEMPGSRHRK